MEKGNKSMQTVAEHNDEDNLCPCMQLVEVSAQVVADELICAIRKNISTEFGERFIDMLREEHLEKHQTDMAIEMLFVMMRLIDSQYALSLMENAKLQNEKRAITFMNIIIEETSLAVCRLEPYVH